MRDAPVQVHGKGSVPEKLADPGTFLIPANNGRKIGPGEREILRHCE
jgi:hypothetical protein